MKSTILKNPQGRTLIHQGMVVVLMFLVTACLWACSTSKLTPSSIDNEAKAEAEKFWATQITKCGDSYFRKLELNKGGESWYELKEPLVRISPAHTSDADRLNGLDWHGNIYLETKVSRTWESDRWSAWENGVNRGDGFYCHMEKAKGKWNINMSRYPYDLVSRYVAVDCSKVPR
jgi:hypothetical protein